MAEPPAALFDAVPTDHPAEYDGCGCQNPGEHILMVQAAQLRSAYDRLVLENTQLAATVADLEDGLTDALERGDLLGELLDTMAYAVAPISEIGEHTSVNCPWQNAIRILLSRVEC